MSKYREDDLKIELETKEYEYGFYTELESDTFHWFKDIVRAISLRKRRTRMDDRGLSGLGANGRTRMGKCKLCKT
jgi:hypothetical protein